MQCDMYTNVPIVEYGCDTHHLTKLNKNNSNKNKLFQNVLDKEQIQICFSY